MQINNKTELIKLMRPISKGWPLDIYGIPYVKKTEIDILRVGNGISLININNTSNKDKNSHNKIIHCFKFDVLLNRFYNQPYRLLKRISKYYAFSTFDFGMHPGMTEAQIINATFKNRWIGVWAQSNGIKNVAVTVGWVDKDTYDICFAGIEDGTLLMISTLSVCNDECKTMFLNGYYEMRKRFPNSQVICLGNMIDGMDYDVCYVPYNESFGNDKYYRPLLFYWNGDLNTDVI